MTASTVETINWGFVEIIVSDEDLLNAEFAAIMSAEWPATDKPTPPTQHRRGHIQHRRQCTRRRRAAARSIRNDVDPEVQVLTLGPGSVPRPFGCF